MKNTWRKGQSFGEKFVEFLLLASMLLKTAIIITKILFFYFTILSVVHRLPKVNIMDFVYKAKKGYTTASHTIVHFAWSKKGSRLSEILQQFQC